MPKILPVVPVQLACDSPRRTCATLLHKCPGMWQGHSWSELSSDYPLPAVDSIRTYGVGTQCDGRMRQPLHRENNGAQSSHPSVPERDGF